MIGFDCIRDATESADASGIAHSVECFDDKLVV